MRTLLKIFVLEDEWIQQSRIEAVLQDLIRQKFFAMQSARSVWEVKPVAGCYHREAPITYSFRYRD